MGAEKKKVYISGGIQEIAVRMWLEAVQCARGKTYCTFNTRDISWDSGDIFCALNVGFGELTSQKQKNQHWEGRSTTFCRNYVYSTGCPSLLWRELVLENLSLSQ